MKSDEIKKVMKLENRLSVCQEEWYVLAARFMAAYEKRMGKEILKFGLALTALKSTTKTDTHIGDENKWNRELKRLSAGKRYFSRAICISDTKMF